MKILTKEEEEKHYAATLKGGILGGIAGIGCGALAVYGASRRYSIINHLTIQMKAFLTTSSGTFAAIISADRASRAFEFTQHPEQQYRDEAARIQAEVQSRKSGWTKAKDLGKEYRYSIVGASWVASMAIALGIVGRNPYLSTTQKLVQARVYAQGLTLAVLVASAAFEIGDKNKGEGRYETVKILDPSDPTHKRMIEKQIHHESYQGEDQWMDMVETEERKMKEREEAAKAMGKGDHSKPKSNHKDGKSGDQGKDEKDEEDGNHSKKTSKKAPEGTPRPPSLP